MTRRIDSGIWWLHPAFVFGTAGVVIAIAAYVIPESTYRAYWRMPKFFDLRALEITFACVAVFIFGALLGTAFMSRIKPAHLKPVEATTDLSERIPWRLLGIAFRISFYL